MPMLVVLELLLVVSGLFWWFYFRTIFMMLLSRVTIRVGSLFGSGQPDLACKDKVKEGKYPSEITYFCCCLLLSLIQLYFILYCNIIVLVKLLKYLE
ncbi:hypothetical protein RND71_042507 [Anisodus tanguticus]|uniref:Transmembrane protein n=1 Tax=Anisodus tanguticus TaxID=243964 RepID=A0AAE1UUQ5_9SOLA|nr:hypothetical protein RND71_042507 [Anisodus tanguticus]